MFDYTKLLSRVAELYGGTDKLMEILGISPNGLSNKLNNISSFKQKEILTLIDELDIKDDEIKQYFFTLRA